MNKSQWLTVFMSVAAIVVLNNIPATRDFVQGNKSIFG